MKPAELARVACFDELRTRSAARTKGRDDAVGPPRRRARSRGASCRCRSDRRGSHFPATNPLAASQLGDLRGVDALGRGEVERVERLDLGKAGIVHAVAYHRFVAGGISAASTSCRYSSCVQCSSRACRASASYVRARPGILSARVWVDRSVAGERRAHRAPPAARS